jgi:hypothetical protein
LLATILFILNDFMRYLPVSYNISYDEETGYHMYYNPKCF